MQEKQTGTNGRFETTAPSFLAALYPLVITSLPTDLVNTINEFGGDMPNARGIAPEQLRHVTKMNICKINVDSDLRLAMTASGRKSMITNPANFNPREYLGAGTKEMTTVCIDEIKNIMGSDNKLPHIS